MCFIHIAILEFRELASAACDITRYCLVGRATGGRARSRMKLSSVNYTNIGRYEASTIVCETIFLSDRFIR